MGGLGVGVVLLCGMSGADRKMFDMICHDLSTRYALGFHSRPHGLSVGVVSSL